MPPMQWLQAHQEAQDYRFQVWLDTARHTASGDPDPAFVREYRWSARPPQGWTGATLDGTAYATWEAYVQAEIQLLAAADLARLRPPTTTLPIEGQQFTVP